MDNKKYKVGDKPGEGKYRCVLCGHIVYIDSKEEELPICPKCFDTNWEEATIIHNL